MSFSHKQKNTNECAGLANAYSCAHRCVVAGPQGCADNPYGLVCPSLRPFGLATHCPGEGRWRRLHILREHLFPVSRGKKVMGQVEASQRGWIQPTGHGLDHAEWVKIAWTQLVWHIQLLTCIKYWFFHATVSSPSQLQLLCNHLTASFLKTCVLKCCMLTTTSYWHVKSFF